MSYANAHAFQYTDRGLWLPDASDAHRQTVERQQVELEDYLAEVRRGAIGVSDALDVALTLSGTGLNTVFTLAFTTLYQDTTVCLDGMATFAMSGGTAGVVGIRAQLDGVDVQPVWPLPPATNNWGAAPIAPQWELLGTAQPGRVSIPYHMPHINVPQPGDHTVTYLANKTVAGASVQLLVNSTSLHVTWVP